MDARRAEVASAHAVGVEAGRARARGGDDGGCRVLVAAVSQGWRRDLEFGTVLLERLGREALPPGVVLRDWSFGTVLAFQRLQDLTCRRTVFLSATRRGRAPGSVHRFVPGRRLPPAEEVHARIVDGATGLVSVDSLLVMGALYRALPRDVVLLEAEPVDDGWGPGLSAPLTAVVGEALDLVRAELTRPPGLPPSWSAEDPVLPPGSEGSEGRSGRSGEAVRPGRDGSAPRRRDG